MSTLAKKQWPAIRYEQIQLGAGTTPQGVAYPGGLDLSTPTLRLQPGALRDGINFECSAFGGYARVEGYERVDGRASPSDASYTIVQIALPAVPGTDDFNSDFSTDFGNAGPRATSPGDWGTDFWTGDFAGAGSVSLTDDWTDDFTTDFTTGPVSDPPPPVQLTPVPTIGQVVTQAFTGATGTVIAVVLTPAYFLVLTAVTGAFDTVHALTVSNSSVPVGTPGPITVSIDARTKAVYTALAADYYRALIGAVPGEGPVQGVVAMAFAGIDHVFAFRANVGATATLLWKCGPTGWVLVPYYNLVAFTLGGSAEPMDLDVLTQGGVTATIKRAMWQGGAWATAAGAGTAFGQFVVTDPVGGSFVAGAATTTSGAKLTLSGPQAPITMASGGKFEFDKANFSGQLITRRIYGVDGVNPAFGFDGETLSPLATGLSPDRPSHVHFHKNFLFLAQDASLIYSGAGSPLKWGAVDGGGEIATGDTITGMITLPGSQTTATLAVFMRTNTAFLYGTDPTTFNYVTFNTGIGAVPHSMQNLFDSFFLDDLGVVTLKTSLNYGNFLPSTLTKNILPFIARERGALMASALNRSKSQYRLFFRDGYGLWVTVLNQQYLGSGLVLFPDVINCCDTTNLIGDDEATYAGSMGGFVYQLDKGTSFDGAPIPAFFTTAWDALKSPRILKRFRAASIEVQGTNYAEIQFGTQLGYNSDQIAQLPSVGEVLNIGTAPHWDNMYWDTFTWDGGGLSPTDVDQTGTAENIRVTISSGSNFIAAYTVDSIVFHFSMRRGLRV